MKSVVLAFAVLLTSVAVAAPPPAPTVTVAAADIKQLQFDITPVTQVNWYELWFRANAGAAWVKFAETPAQRPRFRIGTSVHLLDWRQARYLVKACNPGGCSSSNVVDVDGEQLAAMGYFKPATSGANQYFGFNFALSADGTTLVVDASERIDHVNARAALHVYRKTTSTSGWRLEARLFPSPNESGGGSSVAGDSLSISGDGKIIACSNWVEFSTTGAAYLFRRGSDGWHQTQRITGATATDQFGINIKLDAAGKTLVIAHNQAGGVKREGTLEVYKDLDDASDQFVYATTIPTPPFDDQQWGWCRPVALSEVGHIARSCYSGAGNNFYTQVFTATSSVPLQYLLTASLPGGNGLEVALDSKGERLLVQGDAQWQNKVAMFRRSGNDWVSDGTLSPFYPVGLNHAALSGDGKIVALAYADDVLVGRGPLFDPLPGSDQSGTVAIYERRASGWVLRRYVKADTNNVFHSFGWDVALDQNGHTLAVGSPYDASKATGIDGDREDASVSGRGALWLY